MTRAGRGGFTDRLGVRLGLVIGLALLPVGLMAVMQASDLLAEARARSEAALAGETLRAVRPKLALIKRAQGAAEALAAMDAQGAAACPALRRLVEGGSAFGFAGYYGIDGVARCVAGAAPATLSGTKAMAVMLTGNGPALALLRRGDGPTLVALHPARDAGGVVTGFSAVSPRGDAAAEERGDATQDFSLFVFDKAGEVLSLTAPPEVAASYLPAGRRLEDMAGVDVATFTALSEGGSGRAYSLVGLVEGELFALGTWPAERPGLVAMRALPPLLFPALMWCVGLIAAWFAAEILVAQHIRRLRSAIRDFAGGDRVVRQLDLKGAPKEIRDAGEAFRRMTESILHDEAELEDMLREKEVLLREVHHRVKNNLQLIASIVNMQMRHTRSEEARSIIRSLQERMVSLATIHNGLYQTADLAVIGVGALFPEIIGQVTRNAQIRGQRVAVESHLDPVTLNLDQAVPLALLLTEALSNALKHASTADGSAPRVTVSFRQERSGDVVLDVGNSASGLPPVGASGEQATGIGTQLLRGFARQLNGEFSRETLDGMYRLRVWFPLSPRAEAA